MSMTVLQVKITSEGKVIVEEQTPSGVTVGMPIAPMPPDAAAALAGSLLLGALRAAHARGPSELASCLSALEATGAVDALAEAVPFDL